MSQAQARIENKHRTVWMGPTIKGYPPLTLGPGCAKAVPQAYLDAWGELTPQVQKILRVQLSKGQIVVIPATDPNIAQALAKPELPKAPPNLAGYNEAMATLLIKDESNPEVLRNWLDDERRDDLRKAIEQKLNLFPKGPQVSPETVPGAWMPPAGEKAPAAPEPVQAPALPLAGPGESAPFGVPAFKL